MSCEKSELPDSPKPPGWTAGFFGKAVESLRAYPSWAATPRNFFIIPEEAEYGDEISVRILEYDYIYRFGYYFNTVDDTWEMFELEDGQKVQEWYIGKSARHIIEVDRDEFQIGENYVVLYGCNKVGENYFDCNENKWMLETFRVVPEAGYDYWIIEEDIEDYILLSSDKDKQTHAGLKISVYIAEYMENNDKATVEVAEIDSMASLKSFLQPWNLFKLNYEDYGGSDISSYKLEDEYYVMWLSNKTAVKIHFESEDFPADLVDAYLEKWPSTTINFAEEQLPGEVPAVGDGDGDDDGVTPTGPTCGDGYIRGTERCDPAGSQCILETFDVQEITDGDFKVVDGHTIRILEILSGNVVIISVDYAAALVAEKQIKEYNVNNVKMYVQVFSVLGDTVKLAFGYDLGDCSSTCRCVGEAEPTNATIPTCGNGEKDLNEVCDPTFNTSCTARSGLASTCTATCTCPEPFLGLTFCGNGNVEAPNDFGLMEMCDPPNFQMGSCAVGGSPGWCTLTCQCITGTIGNVCNDRLVGPTEECDPPGTVCTKGGAIGKCSNTCTCNLLAQQPEDIIQLKQFICGKEQYECYGVGASCEKEGKQGECDASCECEVSEEVLNCGNGVVNAGEECDPPGTNFTLNEIVLKTCNESCKWEDVFSQEDLQKIEYCGTTDPECWPIEGPCQKEILNGEPLFVEGFCNLSCECEIFPYCGDETINQEFEECDPPESYCDYISKPTIPIPVAGECNKNCGCEPLYACTCKNLGLEYIDDPEVYQAFQDLMECLGPGCPPWARMEIFDEDIYIIIKEIEEAEGTYEARYAFISGAGELPYEPINSCLCLIEEGGTPTGNAIAIPFTQDSDKTQIIIAIIAMIMIIGILFVNLTRKD